MYKIEQKFVFETRLQVMVIVLFIRLTKRLGTSYKKLLPSPRRPEQDSNTRQGDPPKQEPQEERIQQSIDQNIWKGTKREQHLKCLTAKKRKKFFSFFFRVLYIGKLTVGFQQRPVQCTGYSVQFEFM